MLLKIPYGKDLCKIHYRDTRTFSRIEILRGVQTFLPLVAWRWLCALPVNPKQKSLV